MYCMACKDRWTRPRRRLAALHAVRSYLAKFIEG